ncbi:hypothetical protein SAMN06265339_0387 [Desulfurobacterium pacificum]|uniref:GGDEF domain-containing protein n=1 Tax=Desulfurobacterium pacificum TaxID=240166 RepID=A0ABY1NCT3_9BACT|nr:hypothetical protein [Desulfurobacterium pacificum]SMP06576.1 hypothetical protein SAMN06265339_0387 [Desulfurobacterium pacificum]
MENTGIKKIKEVFRLFKESLHELEQVEYAIELLEKELNEYRELVDRETLLPKAKFVKQKINRLIDRIKYSPEDHLLAVGVNLSLVEPIPEREEKQIMNQIAIYLDRRIRPGDLLFKLSDASLGMVFFAGGKEQAEAIVRRLEAMLLNLKAQTYSTQKVLVNFDIRHLDVTPDMTADLIFEKLVK